MVRFPRLLRWRHLKDKTVSRGQSPSVQLGVFYRYFPRGMIPVRFRGALDLCALKLAPSFGSDGFRIRRARVDVSFRKDQRAIAHDLYPREKEEVTEADLTVGLDADLTFLPLRAGARYRTTLRRIRSLIGAGGILTRNVWWTFGRRRGQRSLHGFVDLVLVIQVPVGGTVRGYARVRAPLQWRRSRISFWRNGEDRLGMRFDVPPRTI